MGKSWKDRIGGCSFAMFGYNRIYYVGAQLTACLLVYKPVNTSSLLAYHEPD